MTKKLKTTTSFILVVALVLMTFLTAFAEELVLPAGGEVGQGVLWNISETGELSITGEGVIPDYTVVTHAPWNAYRHLITGISIGGQITSVGKFAFYGCDQVEQIVVPDNVNSIGGSAFVGCSSLQSISISQNVTAIEEVTFGGCVALTQVSLPDNLVEIQGGAFDSCSALTEVVIPDKVTSIGNAAFEGCESIEKITLPFVGTSSSATGNDAKLKAIFKTVPETLKAVIVTEASQISSGAFEGCSSVESIELGENITVITKEAMAGATGLKNLVLKGDVTSIDDDAFASTDGLTITADNSEYVQTYCQEKGITFDGEPSEPEEPGVGAATVTLNGWTYGEQIATPTVLSETNSTDNATFFYKAADADDSAYLAYVPTAAGNYTVKVVLPENDNYSAATATNSFTIAKRPLVVSNITANGKTYDGTVTATLDVSQMTIASHLGDAICGDDDVTVSASGSFETPAAGLGKNVAITYTISGAAKDNYVIADTSQSTTSADIAQASIANAAVDSIPDMTHTGSALTPAPTVKIVLIEGQPAVTLVKDVDYTVSYSNNFEVGQATVTITGKGSFSGSKNVGFNIIEHTSTEPTITFESKKAVVGKEVTIKAKLSNNPGFNAAKVRIVYDTTRLSLKGVQLGDSFAGSTATLDNLPNLTFVSGSDITDNSEFLLITLDVLPTAEPGIASISLEYEDGDLSNFKEEDVAFAIVPGEITVCKYTPGDINDDGKVNTKDLTRLLRFINEEDVEYNEFAVDVNGDGKANTKDLTRLLRYINEEDVEIF